VTKIIGDKVSTDKEGSVHS